MLLPGFSQTPTVYAGTGLLCPKKAENRQKKHDAAPKSISKSIA
jgi:hypothetical protein